MHKLTLKIKVVKCLGGESKIQKVIAEVCCGRKGVDWIEQDP